MIPTARILVLALFALAVVSGCDCEEQVIEESNGVILQWNGDDAPARITCDKSADKSDCLLVTVEPIDGLATVDDWCGDTHLTVTYQLSADASSRFVAALAALEEQVCLGSGCPPENVVDIVTVSEQLLSVPLESPLKEAVEELLAHHDEHVDHGAQSDEPAAVPDPEPPAQPDAIMVADDGLIFAAQTVFSASHPLKVDLLAYTGSKTLDLVAGAGPTIAQQKNLKLFRTPGGTAAKFHDLHEVPNVAPAGTDRDMVRNAEPGMAFSIQNNQSEGYTLVFVEEATPDHVVLVYQMM